MSPAFGAQVVVEVVTGDRVLVRGRVVFVPVEVGVHPGGSVNEGNEPSQAMGLGVNESQ